MAAGTDVPESATNLRIHLFDTVRLESGGGATATHLGARTLELLAFLILHSETPLSRRFVVVTLWPDEAESEGLARLRRYLFRLNAALPSSPQEPWIKSDKWSLQWNRAAGAWVDVTRFCDACLSAENHDEAIGLYDGPLMSAYEGDWIARIRNSFRHDYEAVLMQAVDSSRRRNDLPAALGYVMRLLDSDPWREDMIRALMDIHDRLGDRAGAMSVFRDFSHRLRIELQVEPMLETREVYERVSEQPNPRIRRKHNLPAPVTSFVGRARELDTLRTMMLALESRVVTLIGPGGVGKSRLAIEVGRSLIEDVANGIWLVELARITDGSNVAKAIADALCVAEESQRTVVDSICSTIDSQPVIILLDNCEHVLDDAALAAAALVKACPNLTILATSRIRLRIGAELRFTVSPLPVPPRDRVDASVLSYPSVDLFRKRASLHGWMLGEVDAAELRSLGDISRALDGLPLAIELAASRLGTLTLGELARSLDDIFEMLIDGSRDALPQHQTMRALVEWSVQFLTKSELAILHYLSLFPGGMTLQAAVSFFNGDGSAAIHALNALVEQ